MKKSESIRKALGISALAYQNCIDTHFHMWCNRYAKYFALPLAKMAGDDHLQNWYREQWLQKVELAFYMDNKDFLEAGIVDPGNLQDLFLAYPDTLINTYPKSLFDALRQRTKTNTIT